MKRFSLAFVALMLFAFAANADVAIKKSDASKLIQDKSARTYVDLNDLPLDFNPTPRRSSSSSLDVLGEIVGTRICIDSTWWESQHNGTVGRMIDWSPSENTAYMVFMKLATSRDGVRSVQRAKVTFDGESFGTPLVNRVDSHHRAGYTTMGFDRVNNVEYPAYHFQNQGDPDNSFPELAAETTFIPNVFSGTQLPDYSEVNHIWPKAVFAEYNGVKYLHVVTHENRDDDVENRSEPMNILYSRSTLQEGMHTWAAPEAQTLVTDMGSNIAADIAVSNDGSKVAIATTMHRDDILHPGEFVGENTGDGGHNQLNNDIYLWVSEDGGATWGDPRNITNFALPEEEPNETDPISSAGDTLRAYTDCNVYYDHDDVLHLTFTAPFFYYYIYDEENDAISWSASSTSMIYHWDDANELFSVVADGSFWNYTRMAAWQRVAQRPNLYQDPDNGVYYCVFVQYGMPDEYTTFMYEGEEYVYGWDRSSLNNYANGEIMVTASLDGLRWTAPINLTESRGVDLGFNDPPDNTDPIDNRLLPGDCHSEREPSVALNSHGDYLHIMYVDDLDAGFYVQKDSEEQEEGEPWNCPVYYHVVSKHVIYDMILENDAYVRNDVPLHRNLDNHYVDPNDWVFDGDVWRDGVDEGTTSQPVDFELAQNYPNPFNPTTVINFKLSKASGVSMKVYDVLGRQVASLVNGHKNAGNHSVTFDGSELASGVYFVKMNAGGETKMIKMMLMK